MSNDTKGSTYNGIQRGIIDGLPARGFINALKTTVLHAAKNDARRYLQGCHVRLSCPTGPRCTVYGTDGHTAARVALVGASYGDERLHDAPPNDEHGVIIATEHVQALIKNPLLVSAAKQGVPLCLAVEWDYKVTDGKVTERGGQRLRVLLDEGRGASGTEIAALREQGGALLDGRYPDVDRVIGPEAGREASSECAGFNPWYLERVGKSFKHWMTPSNPSGVRCENGGRHGPTRHTWAAPDGLADLTVVVMPMKLDN